MLITIKPMFFIIKLLFINMKPVICAMNSVTLTNVLHHKTNNFYLEESNAQHLKMIFDFSSSPPSHVTLQAIPSDACRDYHKPC